MECGPDLVVPHAECFDKEHGKANLLDKLFENQGYDRVYSSDSLEHMVDAPRARIGVGVSGSSGKIYGLYCCRGGPLGAGKFARLF